MTLSLDLVLCSWEASTAWLKQHSPCLKILGASLNNRPTREEKIGAAVGVNFSLRVLAKPMPFLSSSIFCQSDSLPSLSPTATAASIDSLEPANLHVLQKSLQSRCLYMLRSLDSGSRGHSGLCWGWSLAQAQSFTEQQDFGYTWFF